MHMSRFVEASCLQCHHQVTDLIRYGTKEEAPKLLKGYNLVKENGCFGCHEIAGIKSGRPVGPDLRLEPTPALELLSAAEQEKIKADPANPPGMMRKVGPSLRRLAEKTNEDWVRRWVANPRGFRPDTRMPHFYGQSNNTDDVLPPEQQGRRPRSRSAGRRGSALRARSPVPWRPRRPMDPRRSGRRRCIARGRGRRGDLRRRHAARAHRWGTRREGVGRCRGETRAPLESGPAARSAPRGSGS